MNILNPGHYKKEGEKVHTRHAAWIWTYLVLAIGSFTVYFLLNFHVFDVFGRYLLHLKKLTLGVGIAAIILMVSRFIERRIVSKNHAPAAKYNLIRFIRLLAVLIIILLGISLLFENWYTAAVSLGLISLLLGFALQTPITSLIGWIYIVLRTPYHVGDRIQIEEFTGDVVEINYLDTTLWEFGGEYLTNDLPSGRLIRFPNSLVLQYAVFNYSWGKFPYLWNEIPFQLAYESDLRFVEETIKRITKSELNQNLDEKIAELKQYMEKTPISEIDIREYPFVAFRINANTWVEALVTYLVEPKKATDTRSRIIKKVLAELLREPDKALFPKSNNR
jgi:small-conductance mechanosensitive channel